jgi:preprotein translocase subunit YajC
LQVFTSYCLGLKRKEKKEHQQMLAVLAADYEITTIGGFHGT